MKLPTTLRNVDMSGCPVLSELARQILAIYFDQSPEKMKLNFGRFGSQAEYEKSTLKKYIADKKMRMKAAQALGLAIARNKTLVSLDLSQNYNILGLSAFHDIAQGVLANTTLKELNMECCKLGNDGAKEFIDVIAKNNTLTSLDLGGSNDYDESMMINLFQALSKNPNSSLAYLGEASCSVTDQGAIVIADFIATNATWPTLDLKQAIGARWDHSNRKGLGHE